MKILLNQSFPVSEDCNKSVLIKASFSSTRPLWYIQSFDLCGSDGVCEGRQRGTGGRRNVLRSSAHSGLY